MSKKVTEEQKLEIIKLYLGGDSAGAISKTYNITPTSVYGLLKRRNIERRSYSESSRKYTLNESYFEKIDTQEKAYLLGILMADGYNNETRGVIEISFSSKDIGFLEKINEMLGSNKPVRQVESCGISSCRADFCSRKMSDDLKALGCVQAKSLILNFPNIKEDMFSHFIRGYFDGDGCISFSISPRNNSAQKSFNSVVTFVSTEGFCNSIKKILKNKLGVNSSMLCRSPENNNSNRTLQISGNSQVMQLMEWMYLDASVFLERKMDKFIEIKQNIIEREVEAKKLKLLSLIKLSDITRNNTEYWNARYLVTHGFVKSTGNSRFTEEQATELRAKLDEFGETDAVPVDMVEKEFEIANGAGFPYYNITENSFKSSLITLKENDLETKDGKFFWCGKGTEVASFFHPHLFECKRSKKMSPLKLYEDKVQFKKSIRKIIALYTKITPSKIREILRNDNSSSRVNNFPPKVAMSVLKALYGEPNDKLAVLDPCAGFSGRMIGCACSKIVKKYTAIDLSQKTYEGLKKTKEWISNCGLEDINTEIDVVHGDCLTELDRYNNYDFVITSPPFLDVEQYVGVPFMTDYSDWLNAFIVPFITKCFAVLKNGGKMAVYLEKIKNIDFPLDFSNICKNCGFEEVAPVLFRMAYGENNRSSAKDREIKILVFQKMKLV